MVFVARYARAFGVDPLTVARNAETDLNAMSLFYEAALADSPREVD